MLYSFEERKPQINGSNIYIAEEACLIGSVIIENNVCILPYAVIRADNAEIYIGDGTNIQDGAIIHTDPHLVMKIGNNVTIAHKAMLHGCHIGDNTIVAIGATILNNTTIGKNCIIAANTLILENQTIPDNSFVAGSPGKIMRLVSEEEIKQMSSFSKHYIDKICRFKKSLVKIT
ncbi:gamma carbonic anhydrase family protein [Legionella dresdenensis]|uniref:Gamma carbonic anhydrase family protein n=1 Tax=Legionella dresdenensis TaxID=450200 RepID=A0ABV8CEG4_9GAMM